MNYILNGFLPENVILKIKHLTHDAVKKKERQPRAFHMEVPVDFISDVLCLWDKSWAARFKKVLNSG